MLYPYYMYMHATMSSLYACVSKICLLQKLPAELVYIRCDDSVVALLRIKKKEKYFHENFDIYSKLD